MKTRLGLLLLLLTGCQTYQVKTDYDHQAAFGKLRTYCWVPAEAWLKNDPRLRMDVVEPIVRREVALVLSAHGYMVADCPTAEFNVTCSADIEESVTEKDTGEGVAIYEYSPATGGQLFKSASETDVKLQRIPSLTITMTDAKTGKMLWEGTASADLPRPGNDKERAKRVQAAAQLILKEFPPKQK